MNTSQLLVSGICVPCSRTVSSESNQTVCAMCPEGIVKCLTPGHSFSFSTCLVTSVASPFKVQNPPVKLEHLLLRVPYSFLLNRLSRETTPTTTYFNWRHFSDEMSNTNLSWQMHAVLFSPFLLNVGKRALSVGHAALKVIAEGGGN